MNAIFEQKLFDPLSDESLILYSIDIDECPAACVANLSTCTNSPGSFNCECIPGYTGDGENSCVGTCKAILHVTYHCLYYDPDVALHTPVSANPAIPI